MLSSGATLVPLWPYRPRPGSRLDAQEHQCSRPLRPRLSPHHLRSLLVAVGGAADELVFTTREDSRIQSQHLTYSAWNQPWTAPPRRACPSGRASTTCVTPTPPRSWARGYPSSPRSAAWDAAGSPPWSTSTDTCPADYAAAEAIANILSLTFASPAALTATPAPMPADDTAGLGARPGAVVKRAVLAGSGGGKLGDALG